MHETLGEDVDRTFRGRLTDEMPSCLDTGRRTGGDAAAPLAKVRERLTDQVEAGVDVSLEGLFPLIERELFYRNRVLLDGRIVDEDVDCAQLMDGCQDSLLAEARLRDPCGDVYASAAELPDCCRYFFGISDRQKKNDDSDVSTFTCGLVARRGRCRRLHR